MELELYLHTFLTSTSAGDGWPASHASHVTLQERSPGIHWRRGWARPTASMGAMEREISNPAGI
jgi:hypothetical protein